MSPLTRVVVCLGALVLGACAPSGDGPRTWNPELTPHEVTRHERTLRRMVRDVLARPASDAEAGHWLNALRLRIPIVDVARALLDSVDARKALAAREHERLLGRAPERATGKLEELLASDEYFARAGGHEAAFVSALYRDMLGRAPTPSEMAGGRDRMATVRAVLASDEYRRAEIGRWYARYLRRAPDAAGLTRALDALRAGASETEVQARILATPEYASLQDCQPTTCAAQVKNCGSILDGCGGVLACGSCGAGEACGAKRPNVCGAVCRPRTCAEMLADCGSVPDGCGGTMDCGSCSDGATCGGGSIPNVCGGGNVCKRLTCAESGADCGVIGDGCGGLLDCGACR